MRIEDLTHFDLSEIALSGQCFRMEEEPDGSYIIPAADKCVRAAQKNGVLELSCTVEEFEDFWRDYFDLDTDYGRFYDSIDPEDKFLKEAARISSGIRILRQDMWEMIVSFLISQQNNITRIRRCIENICRKYGEKTENSTGDLYYRFPVPESLAGLGEDSLMECNLGYRSKYVVRAARSVCEGELDIEALKTLDYESMRGRLLEVYGVGKKVADCICLFAGHQLSAFPVDTHINQVLEYEYGGSFDMSRYEGFEGVIQQYIFFRELKMQERKGKER